MVPGHSSLCSSLWLISMIEECRSWSFLGRKEDHSLQYVVLSNEVGLSPFLLILVPWLLLVLWRSMQYVMGLCTWYYWWYCFLILRLVLILLLLLLESSGYLRKHFAIAFTPWRIWSNNWVFPRKEKCGYCCGCFIPSWRALIFKEQAKVKEPWLREKGLAQPHYSIQHIEGNDLLSYQEKIKIYIPQSLR
jgi:hypothetical protein